MLDKVRLEVSDLYIETKLPDGFIEELETLCQAYAVGGSEFFYNYKTINFRNETAEGKVEVRTEEDGVTIHRLDNNLDLQQDRQLQVSTERDT